MSWQTWWLYFVTVFLLCATPGPNMLHVLTQSVLYGVRRSVASMAGCLCAVVVVLIASAAGLSAVLHASPWLFEVLRWVGVGYLAFLGVMAWRASFGGYAGHSMLSHAGNDEIPEQTGNGTFNKRNNAKAIRRSTPSPWRLFEKGLLVGFSNPKLLLFAGAFFTQFVNVNAPQGPQYVILIATFAASDSFWYSVYGLGGQGLARRLSRPALRRWFDRVVGSLFLGFGAMLILVDEG